MLLKKSRYCFSRCKAPAFTLVELLVAVSVIAVGMVFVLSAFGRCLSSFETSKKMIRASYLLADKMWEIDLEYKKSNGSIQGEWSGLNATCDGNFSWVQNVTEVSAAAFGEEGSIMEQGFNMEVVRFAWPQGVQKRDLSVTRYVVKKDKKAVY